MTLHHNHKRVRLGGLPIEVVSRREFADMMVADVHAVQAAGANPPLPKVVLDANGHALSYVALYPAFKAMMAKADYIVADGMPLVFTSRWLTSTPLPERVAMTDFVHDAAQAAAATGVSFYLLGDKEDVNAAAVSNLQKMYPNLKIAGRHHGYFKRGTHEEEAVVQHIIDAKPDVLWVALGRPWQEEWVFKNCERLRGIAWIKPTGGLYNFLAGTVSRAPMWMQKAGLEWLYRTLQEPRRLFWRYFTTNIHAIWLLLTQSGDIKE